MFLSVSNRGQCYFFGGYGSGGKMSQVINVTEYAAAIDSNHTSYSFSAWLGGYASQNDRSTVSLTFLNNTQQMIGIQITIGPVVASDRGSVTKFLYRSQSGLVPVNTRYLDVQLIAYRSYGTSNDGYVDNIAVIFNHL